MPGRDLRAASNTSAAVGWCSPGWATAPLQKTRLLNDQSKRVSLKKFRNQQFTSHRIEGGIRFMPEVGDLAPDFELKSHLEKDKKVKLSDFRGKSNVVIAFYPLAWTPV